MPTVCWRLSAWDPDIASVRYRAAIPALHLARGGVSSRLSAGSHGVLDAGRPDAVVFVKAFGDRDVELAREAASVGIPILLDVCDNVFAPAYRAHSSDNLRRMAELAAGVVTTGPALAATLRGELGDALPIHVVPDPLETPDDVREAARLVLRQRAALSLRDRPADLPRALAGTIQRGVVPALRRRFRRSDSSATPEVLWFGNAGSVEPRFGLVNLVDVAEQLRAVRRELRFTLVVVTGERSAYEEHVAPLDLDSRFEPWDRLAIFSRVRKSDAVIVPNSRDAFSVCKSANRVVLALSQGVPVVATRIPSLEPLEGAVHFDDFRAGLVTYLRDRELAADHVRRGREVIEREYAPDVVAKLWRAVLQV